MKTTRTTQAPICGVLAGEPEIIGERCKDGGKCHHECKEVCFRRDGNHCVPLTGSRLNDDWSEPAAPVGEAVAGPGKTHDLKTDPDVFDAVWNGLKTFEIRFNDRNFKVGDWLSLHETKHSGSQMKAGASLIYTGRSMLRQVSHVLSGYGLADGWVCLSLVAPAPALSKEQTEAIASSIRSLRYGAHPHRSPHADDLVKLFPDIKL